MLYRPIQYGAMLHGVLLLLLDLFFLVRGFLDLRLCLSSWSESSSLLDEVPLSSDELATFFARDLLLFEAFVFLGVLPFFVSTSESLSESESLCLVLFVLLFDLSLLVLLLPCALLVSLPILNEGHHHA